MNNSALLSKQFDKILDDLRQFVDLSVSEDTKSWNEWVSTYSSEVTNSCWEVNDCSEYLCPAYKEPNSRCWITAGTLCGGEEQGEILTKYPSCKECPVYRKAVYADPMTELQEHLVVLMHSLRRKHEELQSLATTDELTGLFNRRYFDLFAQKEHQRLARTPSTLILMVIDINDFKLINDQYGHIIGDQVLKQVADVLMCATRKTDLVARYGGDEFVVLMDDPNRQPDISPLLLINRIEKKMEQMQSQHPIEEAFISLSYGCSVLEHTTKLDHSFHAADKAMYRYKEGIKSGRSADSLTCSHQLEL